MAITVRTGGPNPPQLLTPPPTHTGGPLPPSPTPTPSTGGPNPPQPVPGNTMSGLPATSPIQIMDWRAALAQGNTNAQTQQVQGNQLVSQQLNDLTRTGSQYLTQAQDRARDEASSRGMMMSTMAAGAGSRAAIDAGLPIAQADAARYGAVSDENMAATNQDRLADQSNYANMAGQAMGIQANLAESERARGFTAHENAAQRSFTTSERLGTQTFQQQMQTMQNNWQAAQNSAQLRQQAMLQEQQIAHDTAMRSLDRAFQGDQNAKTLAQNRFLTFEAAMQNQSKMLAETITAIYNNPNLNSSQQAAAVANARSVYQSIFQSYAAALSGGVPQIFVNPYPMSAAPRTTTPPPAPPPPPPVIPPGGTGGTGGTGSRTGSMFGDAFRRVASRQ